MPMRRSFAGLVLALTPAMSTVGAQGAASCASVLADACQKAEDVYSYLFPQLGTALAGGHPTLGASDMLGGFGHFTVGVRVTGVMGSLPDLDAVPVTTGPRVASNITTSKQVVPGPALDAAVGVYGGFPLGVTRVGGIDALVSIAYLPAPSSGDTEFEVPDGSVRFGFGARVGLFDESIMVPGVSVAYLRRPLPVVSFRTTSPEGVEYGIDELDVDVGTWRLVATKTFLLFALSGGIGGDQYQSSGVIVASQGINPVQRIAVDRDISRTSWFVGVTFGLGPLHVGAEVGGVSAGSISTFNSFDPAADASRTFASLGVRVGL
jgi:hypothetical protein